MADQLGDDAEFQKIVRLHLPEQLADILLLPALQLCAEAEAAAVHAALDDLVEAGTAAAVCASAAVKRRNCGRANSSAGATAAAARLPAVSVLI